MHVKINYDLERRSEGTECPIPVRFKTWNKYSGDMPTLICLKVVQYGTINVYLMRRDLLVL